LQGTAVAVGAPSDGQVLTYNAGATAWEPATVTGSGSVPDATTTTKGIVQLAGDLNGTAAAPGVAKIKGVVLPASGPSNGQVLTATGATTTAWSTPAAAPVTSVAGKTGVVTLAESDIPSLTTDLAAKATDTAVVHNTGAESVAGVKTFTSAPVVPSNSFPESAVTNLTTDLAAKVPSSRQIATSTGLTGGGDLSADRTLSVVTDSTVQKVEVASGGTLQATRKRLNFVSGTNTTVAVTDDNTNNKVDVAVNTTGLALSTHTHTFRLSYTWTVAGNVNVPAADVDYINPIFVGLASGQTAQIVGYKAVIHSGTSATLSLQKNGSAVTGITGVTITTTAGGASGLTVSLADGDMLAPVISSTSGGPQNLSLSVFYEVTH